MTHLEEKSPDQKNHLMAVFRQLRQSVATVHGASALAETLLEKQESIEDQTMAEDITFMLERLSDDIQDIHNKLEAIAKR